MSRYIPVAQATEEDLAARKLRYERWKAKRVAAGLSPTPYRKRTDKEKERAKELARNRYKAKPKRPSDERTPNEKWLRRAIISARHRAKKKGIAFDITEQDVTIPTHCPILGIELQVNNGRATRKNGNSPSLDRIANEHGYIKGNVRVISARANHLKSDATIDELYAVLRDMCANASRHTLTLGDVDGF